MCKLAKYVRSCVVFLKFLHKWQIFYTTAGRDGRDRFQVWYLTFTFSPVLGPLLLHVRSSRVRRPPTLVPPGGRPLLPRHHLLLPLLPLLSRATQQAGRQLADGGELDSRVNITSWIVGVLVHSRRYLCLLHRLCRHACQLQRKRRWGLAVLDWRQHCRWGEFFLQLADVEWCTVHAFFRKNSWRKPLT